MYHVKLKGKFCNYQYCYINSYCNSLNIIFQNVGISWRQCFVYMYYVVSILFHWPSFVYYCYSIFVLMYKYSSPMFKTILNHDFHDNLQCRDFSWHIQVYTANIIKYTPGPSWQPIERKKCHISNLYWSKSALFTHDHDHLLHLFFYEVKYFIKQKKIYTYTIWKKMRILWFIKCHISLLTKRCFLVEIHLIWLIR